MKKELTTLEIININAWASQLTQEKMDVIPLKIKYALKKFITKIDPDVKAFNEFKNGELDIIREKYFNDEKSDRKVETIMDENNEPVLDEDGLQQTREILVVKDEFMPDYQDEVQILNEKLNEILLEKNIYEYNACDIEDMVNNLPDDTPLEWVDVEILDELFSEGA